MANEPKMSYIDAMRLEINGTPVCVMSAETFSAWIEQHLVLSSHPEALRVKLAGHDYRFFTDRWHALLTIFEEQGRPKLAD